MPSQSAAERFCSHAELMSLTLRHLDRSHLVRLSPTLLPHVAAIIYRRVDYARYLDTFQLTSVSELLYFAPDSQLIPAMEADLPKRHQNHRCARD